MVNVNLNQYQTSPPTYTSYGGSITNGATTHNGYYAQSTWLKSTAFVTVPDTCTLYMYGYANDGGNSANQAYNKLANSDESVTAFSWQDTNGQSQQTYIFSTWTNSTGQSQDLYLYSRNYNPTQPTSSNNNGGVTTTLVMSPADLASGWEEFNLASFGTEVLSLERNRKVFVDKHYVLFQSNQSNLKIDGVTMTWGGINELDVGTIVPVIGFNWGYNANNKIFYTFKGAGFQVS